MKVKFLKDWRDAVKLFKKDTVVEIHHSYAKDLIKKKIAEETDEITNEEKVIKLLKKD